LFPVVRIANFLMVQCTYERTKRMTQYAAARPLQRCLKHVKTQDALRQLSVCGRCYAAVSPLFGNSDMIQQIPLFMHSQWVKIGQKLTRNF